MAFRPSNDSVQVKIQVGRNGAGTGEEAFVLDTRNQKVFYQGVNDGLVTPGMCAACTI